MNMFIQMVESVQETTHVHREERVCSTFPVRERGKREELVS